jgi:hypothetical protein
MDSILEESAGRGVRRGAARVIIFAVEFGRFGLTRTETPPSGK